jgi:hypothetical protein
MDPMTQALVLALRWLGWVAGAAVQGCSCHPPWMVGRGTTGLGRPGKKRKGRTSYGDGFEANFVVLCAKARLPTGNLQRRDLGLTYS